MIEIHCPDCHTIFERPNEDSGKTTFCPKCYFMLVVPRTKNAQTAHEAKIQKGEPAYQKSMANPADDFVVVCPQCRKPTDCLKVIEVRNIICFLAFITWNKETLVGCSNCVRADLRSRMFFALPAANLFFPIPLFSYLRGLSEAALPGHSDAAAAKAYSMTTSAYVEQLIEKPRRNVWYWVAVTALLLFIGALVILMIFGRRR
jgi:hypothetical protein